MPSYPAYPGPYATQGDLAAYWRPLTSAEQARATVLLGEVADRINELPNPASLVNTACHWVSLHAVKRAMIGGDGDGVKTLSQSMTGMSVDQTFVNPAGEVYITAREINRLRGRNANAAGSVTLSSQARVPLTDWGYQWVVPRNRVDFLMVYPTTLALTVGEQSQVEALGTTYWEYEDVTALAEWTSSDPTVATVDNNGMITAVAAGSASVTAEHQGFKASCAVTVS